MPKPLAWRVSWGALGASPAGHLDIPQRAKARGFYIMRKAAGYPNVTIAPVSH